jgi:predicted nuclease of predicted toxin-antitoxin system
VKIKLDENLPDRLVTVFTGLGHDVDTIHAEHLIGRADSEVWSAVQAAQRFLITQDLDFSDMPRFTPGTHAGLLLVRLTRAAVTVARQAEDQTHGLGLHRIDLQGSSWCGGGRTAPHVRQIDRSQDAGAAAAVAVDCKSDAGRRQARGSRSDVVMSGIVDSGHGNIDANDASETLAVHCANCFSPYQRTWFSGCNAVV